MFRRGYYSTYEEKHKRRIRNRKIFVWIGIILISLLVSYAAAKKGEFDAKHHVQTDFKNGIRGN